MPIRADRLRQVLNQRATQGDVEELHPAADPENWQASVHGAAGQRQLEPVALGPDLTDRRV